jgi:hypothetical protein
MVDKAYYIRQFGPRRGYRLYNQAAEQQARQYQVRRGTRLLVPRRTDYA